MEVRSSFAQFFSETHASWARSRWMCASSRGRSELRRFFLTPPSNARPLVIRNALASASVNVGCKVMRKTFPWMDHLRCHQVHQGYQRCLRRRENMRNMVCVGPNRRLGRRWTHLCGHFLSLGDIGVHSLCDESRVRFSLTTDDKMVSRQERLVRARELFPHCERDGVERRPGSS